MWAVRIVASKGIRKWWDEESGRLGFIPEVRELIDRKLDDEANPPIPLNQTWNFFTTAAWQSSASDAKP